MAHNGKPLMFISYACEDEKIAQALSKLLKRVCPAAKVWFSGDGRPGCGCTHGRSWFDDIHDHLESAHYIFTLVTANSIGRPWIYWESGIGYVRHNHGRVVPVLLGITLGELKPPLEHLYGVEAGNPEKLCAAMLNVANDLDHEPLKEDVEHFCAEFWQEVEGHIPSAVDPQGIVLADRSLIGEEEIENIAARLAERLQPMVQERGQPEALTEDMRGTRPPDSGLELAARQVVVLDKAGAKLPSDVKRVLAGLLYESGELEPAVAILTSLTAEADAGPEDHSNLGVALGSLGRLREAEEAYRKAIEIDPTLAAAWSNLGNLLSNAGRTEEAEEAYRKAIETDPEYAKGWGNLGGLLSKTGRTEEAEEAYRKAIDIDPQLAEEWHNLGILLSDAGREREAEEACRKAVDIDPQLAEGWSNLGILLSDAGRAGEAEEAYRAGIDANPGDADLRNQLAYLLCETGRLSEAETVVREALAIDPDHSYANATLGLILFERDQLEEGRRCYEKAIEIKPDDKRLQQKFHFEYGRALGRNGHSSEARKHLMIAKKSDAGYVPMQQIDAELAKLDGGK